MQDYNYNMNAGRLLRVGFIFLFISLLIFGLYSFGKSGFVQVNAAGTETEQSSGNPPKGNGQGEAEQSEKRVLPEITSVFGVELFLGSGNNSFFTSFYRLLLYLGGLIAIFMIIWGGFNIMLGGRVGKQELYADGKNKIFYAVTGLILLFSSALILNAVNPRIGTLEDIFKDLPERSSVSGEKCALIGGFLKVALAKVAKGEEGCDTLFFNTQKHIDFLNTSGCIRATKTLADGAQTEIVKNAETAEHEKLLQQLGYPKQAVNVKAAIDCGNQASCESSFRRRPPSSSYRSTLADAIKSLRDRSGNSTRQPPIDFDLLMKFTVDYGSCFKAGEDSPEVKKKSIDTRQPNI